VARRMIRFAGKKKRKNPSRKRAPTRRRRRRNPDGATAAKKKKTIRSISERQAGLQAQMKRLEAQANKQTAAADKRAAAAEKRAAKAQAAQARAVDRGMRRVYRKGVGVFGEETTPAMKKYLAGKYSKPRKRKGAKRGTTTRQRKARQLAAARLVRSGNVTNLPAVIYTTKKGKQGLVKSTRGFAATTLARKGSSKARKSIANAWRSAQKAQGLATSAEDRRVLRAMGLAGVPNPSLGGLTKDLGTLMPKIGVTVGSFGLMAVVGQKAGKWVEDKVTSETAKPFVVPGVTLALAVGGWAITRRMKKTAGLSAFILAGGVMAAALHALIRVRVGGVSIGQKIGLPIALGEYASMAGGYGEYAAQAGLGGGTSYSGERGIFSGLDDTDPLLSGMDDGDEVSLRETLDDEGVNTDEGSLNGNIFD
jgi:hypothetical protein